jgi:hypothetical protein
MTSASFQLSILTPSHQQLRMTRYTSHPNHTAHLRYCWPEVELSLCSRTFLPGFMSPARLFCIIESSLTSFTAFIDAFGRTLGIRVRSIDTTFTSQRNVEGLNSAVVTPFWETEFTFYLPTMYIVRTERLKLSINDLAFSISALNCLPKSLLICLTFNHNIRESTIISRFIAYGQRPITSHSVKSD